MELTNSFFLGRVIDELHESKDKTGDELREAPDVAWDQEAFTTRYGLASLPVFEGLQTLYRLCEAETKRIIKASGQGKRSTPFKSKTCFSLLSPERIATWKKKELMRSAAVPD
jgi:hypothetical protein